jgi:hypothetical protein
MAVTELPFGSLLTGNSFVAGDRTKRSSWAASFFIPPTANADYVLRGGLGAVTASTGATVTFSIGGPGGLEAIMAGGQYAGTVTGLQQVYVADSPGGANGFVVPVNSVAPTFPDFSLPLAVLVLDGVGRIQQIIDVRPSYLYVAPSLGTGMVESVSDATMRVSFQNNYAVPRTFALTPQIPQDISLPAPGFLLGSGSVVLSGNVITTPTTYLSTATRGGRLVTGINQGYIDPTTGALTTRQTQTSGVFPANCLPIFEATVDSVSLIRKLVDWRPSYV